LLGDGDAEVVDGLAFVDVDDVEERGRVDLDVAAEGDVLDLLFLGDDEGDDDAGRGGLGLGFDIGEFFERVDALVVLFDGVGIEGIAFLGADDVEDDVGRDLRVAHDADIFDGFPAQGRVGERVMGVVCGSGRGRRRWGSRVLCARIRRDRENQDCGDSRGEKGFERSVHDQEFSD